MRRNGLLSSLIAGAQSISPRRLLLFLSGILLLSTTLLLFTSANLSTEKLYTIKYDLKDSVSQLTDKVYVPKIFKPATHQPPPPATNGTANTEGWFATWAWLNLFSAGDGDRVALPPLQRCPIYTYYEPAKDKTQSKVDNKLLLAWRRVWWAYGFKPVILGPQDAKQSGFYEMVYRANLTSELSKELMRWSAWNQMEGGILVDYNVFPMGPHDDVTISALRRCKFVYMNRFQKFDQKLYSSDKTSLNKILMHITSNPPKSTDNVKTIEAALSAAVDKPDEWIHVDSFPAALADYSPDVVKQKYPELKPADLPNLVNAHLHSTFLTQYPDGISLLSPFPLKLGALNHPGLELANRIAACPVSNPLPQSCPPNLSKCTVCNKPAAIISPDYLSDSTKYFTLGTVPHPYVTVELTNDDISLLHDPESRSLRFIRRKSIRDPWLKEVTKIPFMKSGLGAPPRATKLKEIVAAKQGSKFLSMWSTDKVGFKDIGWTLGFVPPTIEELGIKLPPAEETQKVKLEAAKKVAFNKRSRIVRVVEGWSLSDSEVWRFVNAWRERRILEREQWTKKERTYGLGLDKQER
ncbi:hypothetical protein K440DRAFT_594826 [Wilcoxina mikolae CBS 423.85]|nr:hypothetical protein K440DRAFT_594826 [Wilcoxina mikolae CBS 423.85]